MTEYKNKKVTIMGLGLYEHGSGIEAAKFFIRQGAAVLVTDLRSPKMLRPQVLRLKQYAKKYKVAGQPPPVFHLGEHRTDDFVGCDVVVKNPGVKNNSPFLALAARSGVEITTDIILFFNRTPSVTIGITGTRGKSTTSSLIAAILKFHGRGRVFFGGNNTISPLSFLERIKKDDLTVLELSSWALEGLEKIKKSPSIAVVTNIYPDHLNTYDSMADYIKAKKNIFRYQGKNDTVILNRQNAETKAMAPEAPGRVVWFDRVKIPGSKLLGEHNEANIAAAVAVAKQLRIPNTKIVRAIKNFKGLPGRLEFVRATKNGVQWYNDTTATSPDGTRAALQTFAGQQKHLVLIAGGVDKNLPYDGLGRELAQHAKTVILLPGTATEKIKSEMSHFIEAKNMMQAVRAARLAAGRGDVVLLSPGAASMNIFKNEFDRGEQFVAAVKKLSI